MTRENLYKKIVDVASVMYLIDFVLWCFKPVCLSTLCWGTFCLIMAGIFRGWQTGDLFKKKYTDRDRIVIMHFKSVENMPGMDEVKTSHGD